MKSYRQNESRGKAKVVVSTEDIINPIFGGVGFQIFHHQHSPTEEHFNRVIAKRWRELNPSFARVSDRWDWEKEELNHLADHLHRLEETGTEVYLTTFGPKDTEEGEERSRYASKIVDNLEYLIRECQVENISYYCMTNELSLNEWASLTDDLPTFQDYHQKIFDELKRRKLDVKLLATDASPFKYWDTIEWAAKNMDGITGVYGGHHYINDHDLKDKDFYEWFLSKMEGGADLAKGKGKKFILGEFGCQQDGSMKDGVKMDRCVYWDTPQESLVGIQLAEAVFAAINGGIYGLANWTFTDFPDDYSDTSINKWGTFKWSGGDFSTRDHYYAYGLLTKYFRGPATVFNISSDNGLLRGAAIQHHSSDSYSIGVVNRSEKDVEMEVDLEGRSFQAQWRKYVYRPEEVPSNQFGDLQAPKKKIKMEKGSFDDVLKGGSLTVYTTDYDEQPPRAVRNLKTKETAGGVQLNWEANPESEVVYYNVYRSKDPDFAPNWDNRVDSTVKTKFLDKEAEGGNEWHYKVLAVDRSGNLSEESNS